MQRYGAEPAPPQPQYRDEPGFDDHGQEPARYDDALFGQLDTGGPAFQRQQPYPDDPYAFQDEEYDDGEEEEAPRRGNGLAKVAVFLVLGVIGTGAAFAYRSYMGTSRSGDPPIIRADNSPTKILTPVPADGITKLPDRLGDQGEKMVSREETPVDVNTRSVSPRVVFPPPNQSGGAPPPASNAAAADAMQMPPVAPPDSPACGGMRVAARCRPANRAASRRCRCVAIRRDDGACCRGGSDGRIAEGDEGAQPAGFGECQRQCADVDLAAGRRRLRPPRRRWPRSRRRRMRPRTPRRRRQIRVILVSVSSQKSEADAQASFRALKAKYADAMGSYSAPVIKKVDVPGKGVMYRAMVGPFDTSDAANQFCKGLTDRRRTVFRPKEIAAACLTL